MKIVPKGITPIGIVAAAIALAASANAAVIFTEDWDGWNGGAGSIASEWSGVVTVDILDSATYTNPTVTSQIGDEFLTMYRTRNIIATLTDTFAMNSTYTLDFSNFRRDFGVSGGHPVTAEIGYDDGSYNVLSSMLFPAVTDVTVLEARTLSWTPSAGGVELGESIAVRFFTTDSAGSPAFQAGIDNITVTQSLVPEPSRALLLGIGTLSMLLRRRR